MCIYIYIYVYTHIYICALCFSGLHRVDQARAHGRQDAFCVYVCMYVCIYIYIYLMALLV